VYRAASVHPVNTVRRALRVLRVSVGKMAIRAVAALLVNPVLRGQDRVERWVSRGMLERRGHLALRAHSASSGYADVRARTESKGWMVSMGPMERWVRMARRGRPGMRVRRGAAASVDAAGPSEIWAKMESSV
jgi:hypothetical protein